MIAGRTKCSKLTNTLTGFPGRPVRLALDLAEPLGMPGCIATL